ncbi:MAG: metal ABC transporter ATP-binding protein [Spirochaetaceae bacterium]|jgi:zinc transport system ATP-binding protein|nr:metal ABC transporter ATP-binding protein [Spirochaetaceae bacterium]
MALITCVHAAFAYDGGVVIHDIDFSVEPGDMVCVTGENGSGKTTLIKGMLRLIAPKAGSVVYGEGFSLRQAAYLPQQNAAQKDFPASVEEIVLSGRIAHLGLRPFFTKADKDIARRNMELLGISNLRRACFRELSGGQQKRVLIARALCAQARLLFLDEPASGLDPQITAEVYSLFEDLNRQGAAIVMVTHDPEYAHKRAKKILRLCSGTAVGAQPE